MSGADGSAAARRRDAWRKIHITCECGRTVYGNGKSHQRACEVHLRERGWPLDDGMADAIREVFATSERAHVIDVVQRGLGREYLARRATGDKTAMRWVEYRDLVWKLADEAMQS